MHRLQLRLLPELLAVCRLPPGAAFPAWLAGEVLWSVTATAAETSIVCREAVVPGDIGAVERGWRAFELAGPIPFGLIGILAAVLDPLAAAGVPIFAFSTYDTDYVLVQRPHLDRACESLRAAGHVIL